MIADLLENLDQYHWHFFPVLKCLHVVTSNLPRHPLGKKVKRTSVMVKHNNGEITIGIS